MGKKFRIPELKVVAPVASVVEETIKSEEVGMNTLTEQLQKVAAPVAPVVEEEEVREVVPVISERKVTKAQLLGKLSEQLRVKVAEGMVVEAISLATILTDTEEEAKKVIMDILTDSISAEFQKRSAVVIARDEKLDRIYEERKEELRKEGAAIAVWREEALAKRAEFFTVKAVKLEVVKREEASKEVKKEVKKLTPREIEAMKEKLQYGTGPSKLDYKVVFTPQERLAHKKQQLNEAAARARAAADAKATEEAEAAVAKKYNV